MDEPAYICAHGSRTALCIVGASPLLVMVPLPATRAALCGAHVWSRLIVSAGQVLAQLLFRTMSVLAPRCTCDRDFAGNTENGLFAFAETSDKCIYNSIAQGCLPPHCPNDPLQLWAVCTGRPAPPCGSGADICAHSCCACTLTHFCTSSNWLVSALTCTSYVAVAELASSACH